MKRACAYLRVSTKMQVDGGYSLAEQRADIMAYCKKNGYELRDEDIFEDAGISGARRYRPEFVRMLDGIKARHYDVLVAWRIDRLTRSGTTGYRLRDALDFAKCSLECVAEHMDRETFGLLVWLAERERGDKVTRGRMGTTGKAKTGKVQGTVKYGYSYCRDGKIDPDTGNFARGPRYGYPVVNEAEAEVVRRVFREYTAGIGVQAVSNRLTADGVPTRNGGCWWPTRVWEIISDPIYTGKGYYGKRRYTYEDTGTREIKHTQKTESSDWIEIPYPRLIDDETFAKAQETRKYQRRKPRGLVHSYPYMLRGILWCGSCGVRYTYESSYAYSYYTNKDGVKRRNKLDRMRHRYACSRGKQIKTECSKKSIYVEAIEPRVWKKVVEFLTERGRVDSWITEQRAELEQTGTLPELKRARAKLKAIDVKRQRLAELFLSDLLTSEELEKQKAGVMADHAHYTSEIEHMERQVASIADKSRAIDEFIDRTAHLRERLETATREDMAEICQLVISRVAVTEDGIRVSFGSNIIESETSEQHQSPS